jgi:hypothetical protein
LEQLLEQLLCRQSFGIDVKVQIAGGKNRFADEEVISEEGSAMKLADFCSPAVSLEVEADVDQPQGKRLNSGEGEPVRSRLLEDVSH